MAVIEPFRATELLSLSASLLRVLRAGGVVAIPTETYYGLGVNPFDAASIEHLMAIKGRPDGKPILVLIGDRSQLHGLVERIPPVAQVLMDAFWPGPLTIVFSAAARLPERLTAGTGTIGVRLTSCGPLADLLQQVGPLTGTSANRSGMPPLCTAADVNHTLGEDVALIVDAGATPGGLPSTIVSVCNGVTLIREGAIDRTGIQHVLKMQGLHFKLR